MTRCPKKSGLGAGREGEYQYNSEWLWNISRVVRKRGLAREA